MRVHVLVPAAGAGRRIGTTVKKQYLELGDRPILAHTLGRLAAQDAIDLIHLIVPASEVEFCRDEIVARYQLTKIGSIVVGGAERQDSVRHGLESCGAAAGDVVLIHDGVRPFFPAAQIAPLVARAAADGACLLAVPAQDTIKQVEDGRVRATLDRRLLWQVQTPQAFRCEVILAAHRQALAAGYTGTDDASLVEWCGGTVAVLPGSAYNLKITTPADLALARALLNAGEVELT